MIISHRKVFIMYTYAWYHWLTFFYIYCFFGWIFESTYVSLKERRFVNRGFLRLPLLPLYGTGAVMMLWVSLPVKNNLFLVYISGVIAATVLEYITGSTMERLFKMKYWDYSNQPFNIRGYICLSSSIAWGFLTIFMTEIVHKPIEEFVLHLNPVLEFALIGVISAAFAADTVQSVREALDLGRALEAMTKMKAELEEIQVQIALLKAETSQRMNELKEDTAQRVSELRNLKEDAVSKVSELKNLKDDAASKVSELKNLKDDAASKVSELKTLKEDAAQIVAGLKQDTALRVAELKAETEAALNTRLELLIENRRKLKHHMTFYRKGILRGNPTASSKRFADALKELKDTIEQKKST